MSIKIAITNSSLNNVATHLTNKQNNVLDAGHRGLSEAAEVLFAQAQSLVPRKTGALAASGKITYQSNTKSESAIISYGDATVNPNTGRSTALYAVEKHESPGPGGKWLENTMMGGYDVFMDRLITHISDEL